MEDRSDDSRQDPAPRTERDSPSRPDMVLRSQSWPETGNMQAHNQAANRIFKTNSTKLQRKRTEQQKVNSHELPQPNETTREPSASPTRLEKGDYAGLRLETAKRQGKGVPQEELPIPEGTLTFPRDRKKQKIENAPQKRDLKDGELSFSRSHSARDLSRGR